MPDSQQWEVSGNAVLYSFIQKFAAVRFFEYAANSAAGERLRREVRTFWEALSYMKLPVWKYLFK